MSSQKVDIVPTPTRPLPWWRRVSWTSAGIILVFVLVTVSAFALERAFGKESWAANVFQTWYDASIATLAGAIMAGAASFLFLLKKAETELAETEKLRLKIESAHAAFATQVALSTEPDVLKGAVGKAVNEFLSSDGKGLLAETVVGDVFRSLSMETRGVEERYRIAFDNLRGLSAQPRALAPAITFLYERGIETVHDEIRRLRDLDLEFELSGADQIALSRSYLQAAGSSVEFVDFQVTAPIKEVWTHPFLRFVGEIANDPRIREREQTVICETAELVTDPSRSPALLEQIRFMLDHRFRVYLVDRRSVLLHLKDEMGWRFEIYDRANCIRVRKMQKYTEGGILDIAVTDAGTDRTIKTLRRVLFDQRQPCTL